jgi:DNA ligase-1
MLTAYLYSKLRWISEKLDGVRAHWNGSAIVSKHGKGIWCPDWFIENFPANISLDGELWCNRGAFELLNGVLGSAEDSLSWKQISYMIFDLPSSEEPFEIRMRDLKNMKLPRHVCVLDIERCRGMDHLQSRLVQILDLGGEGLMVNKPNSFYAMMRTNSLLKVKVCFVQSL